MRHSKTIKGYSYQNEQDAIAAVEKCNNFYLLPLENNANNISNVTTSWTGYNKTIYNNPFFYYIAWDESLNVVLGEPEELIIYLEEETK